MKKAIIDCDVLVYWSAFAMQKTKYLHEGTVYPNHKALKEAVEDPSAAEKFVDVLPENLLSFICQRNLKSILEALGTTDYELWLTGKKNYREDIAVTKEYKGGRSEKPVLYAKSREWFISKGAKIIEPFEADDIMAARSLETGGIICTIDKDLDMIPGLHYNWKSGRKYRISESTGLYKFLIQLLTGDSVDTIPGLPKYGDKKAKGVVREAGSPQKAFKAIRELYNNDEYLTEQARLLWIKRSLSEPLWDISWFEENILKVMEGCNAVL